MNGSQGRVVLGVLTFVALASTLLTLVPTMPVIGQLSCPGNCSGASHGACLNGTCSCTQCYSGLNCSIACSGRGACINQTTCSCAHGFTGPKCQDLACPNDCSGRGDCFNGSCSCFDCYSGDDCGIECTDHGTCGGGACNCAFGWNGSLCEMPIPCPAGCGNGTCVDDACRCDPGFIGKNCLVAACTSNADCDDADACTRDSCDAASGVCQHAGDVAACLDSLKCYKAVTRKGAPKFVPRNELLVDAFDPKHMIIRRPAMLCAPVSRDGSAVINSSLGLECFKIKQTSDQERFPGADVVDSQTDFGSDQLRLMNPQMLCLPATLP